MSDSESSATLFELLYLFCPNEAQNIIHDNGCHFQDYMLNRDPAWSKDKRVFIDKLHYKGHKHCCRSVNAGAVHTAVCYVAIYLKFSAPSILLC
jgi:hypothetical protein